MGRSRPKLPLISVKRLIFPILNRFARHFLDPLVYRRYSRYTNLNHFVLRLARIGEFSSKNSSALVLDMSSEED